MFFDQREFDVRCEWGAAGLRQLAATSDAMVIVDVLSFATCVDIAVGNGASVYPYQWQDTSAVAYAHSHGKACDAAPCRQTPPTAALDGLWRQKSCYGSA